MEEHYSFIKEASIFTITPRAVEEILMIKKENNIPENYELRVGIKSGGCSGFTYVLTFDENSKNDDKVIQNNGLTTFIDSKSLVFLAGAILEFRDNVDNKGFYFDNPNNLNSCDCSGGSCH